MSAIPILTRVGYALSDPTRAAIMLALASGEKQPGELAENLGVSRQSISNHLTCLRGCALVSATKVGRNRLYRLSTPALGHAITELAGLSDHLPVNCDCYRGCDCT